MLGIRSVRSIFISASGFRFSPSEYLAPIAAPHSKWGPSPPLSPIRTTLLAGGSRVQVHNRQKLLILQNRHMHQRVPVHPAERAILHPLDLHFYAFGTRPQQTSIKISYTFCRCQTIFSLTSPPCSGRIFFGTNLRRRRSARVRPARP